MKQCDVCQCIFLAWFWFLCLFQCEFHLTDWKTGRAAPKQMSLVFVFVFDQCFMHKARLSRSDFNQQCHCSGVSSVNNLLN